MRGKKAGHVSKVLISVRLDQDVYDYFKKHHPSNTQQVIRAVLNNYVYEQTKVIFNGEQYDNDPSI